MKIIGKDKGLTIIELLVIIAAIGLIVGFAISVFSPHPEELEDTQTTETR